MNSVKATGRFILKKRNIVIDELSAYRVLFICACILSLIAGIFAIQNSAAMIKLNSSLSIGEYQDKAEVIKASNDTQCLYGSLNPAEYDFAGQKDTALSCLQYSRALNSYYLDLGSENGSPDIDLNYSYSDVTQLMEFCSSEAGKKGEAKELAIGNLGTTFVSCKEDAVKGQYVTLAAA